MFGFDFLTRKKKTSTETPIVGRTAPESDVNNGVIMVSDFIGSLDPSSKTNEIAVVSERGNIKVIRTDIMQKFISNSNAVQKIFRDAIIGKCDGIFPVTNPIKDNIYYYPVDNKYYKCVTSHTGTVIKPDDKFKEFSLTNMNDTKFKTINILGAAKGSGDVDERGVVNVTTTVNWADISGKPSSMKNPNNFVLQLNGKPQTAYDGSTAVTVNVTPQNIGAQPVGNYAASNHNHDDTYSKLDHTHSQYQPKGDYANRSHNHSVAAITNFSGYVKGTTAGAISESDNLITAIGKLEKGLEGKQNSGNYSPVGHNHDDRYFTETEITDKLKGYSLTTHNHSGVYQPVGNYSAEGHKHDDLYQPKGSYAASNHNHDSVYAKISHGHTVGNVSMSGYTKGETSGAIATTDTLGAALGKIEVNLDGKQAKGNYANADHNHDTVYAAKSHNHNDLYDTKDEINTKLSGYSPTSHNHNGTYQPKGDYAVNGHHHSSSSVTNMNGYAKASTVAAIEPSDSLNVALGKLEKALDSKQASGSYAPQSHNHNDLYYGKGEVDSKLGGYSKTEHTHVSSEVRAMTGYSKAETYSAIAATDALNTAIGKLEKGLDTKQPAGSYATAGHNHDSVYSKLDHNHNGVYQPAGSYAAANHNHDSVYQPKGSYAASSHNHSGSNVTNLTGYKKAENVGAIAETDGLLGALGKLEKSLDGKQPSGNYSVNGHNHNDLYDTKDEVNNKLASYSKNGHTHNSGNITAMTGYVKASAAGVIAATDSLNTAIGKLEKALDGKQSSGSYAPSNHSHNDLYYGKGEIDTKLKGYSVTSHNHDSTYSKLGHTHNDVYNTKTEITNLLSGKLDKNANAVSASKLATPRTIAISGAVAGSATFDGSGSTTIVTGLAGFDAAKIVSGTISVDRLPKTALSEFVAVANKTARLALTKTQVQNGDTVKETDTKRMFLVIDDTKLNLDAGYQEYTTIVDWASITGKPSTFNPTTHSHTWEQISNRPITMVNPHGLTISLNGKAQTAYTGASAVAFNITPASIGAQAAGSYALSNHNHDSVYAKLSHSHSYLPLSGGTVNGRVTSTELQANNYILVRDFYGTGTEDKIARIWFAGDKNASYNDQTLRIDQISGVKINNNTVWHSGNFNPSGKSDTNHNHDSVYSKLSHNHDDKYQAKGSYAASSHNHTSANITGLSGYAKASSVTAISPSDSLNIALGKLEKALDGKQPSGSYASSSHNHDTVYAKISHTHTEYQPKGSYAAANHNHDTVYAAKVHNHDDKYQPKGNYQPAGSYAAASHTHDDRYFTESEINSKLSGYSPTSHNHDLIVGNYTSNGGNQPPKYIPSGRIRFNMMRNTVNGNDSYKDWLLMDTYNGSDVPYVTAFGISKSTELKAFIMNGSKNGEEWARTAELWTTANFNPSNYAASNHNHDTAYAAKSHSHNDLYNTKTEITNLLKGYSPTSHNHSGVYAPVSHTHSEYQPKGSYAAADHNHNSVYAPISHTHSYLPLAGGTLTGEVITPHNSGFKYRAADGTNRWLISNNGGNEIALGYTGNGQDVPVRAYNEIYAMNDKKVWHAGNFNPASYSTTSHNHDSVYAKISHTHTEYQPKGSYAASSHTHTASQVSGLPTALKNPTALSIQLNGGTATSYDGSAAKSINITAASIGAQVAGSYAAANHNHDTVYQPKGSYAAASHTHPYLSTSGGTISGALTVTGQILSNADVVAYSDKRFKTNIKLIDNPLEKINKINGYYYDMMGVENEHQVGVIAQELQEVLPEAVFEDKNGHLGVRYTNIVPVLIEAVKSLKNENDELKDRLDRLERILLKKGV